jgi:glutaredoxin 3
MNDFHPTESRGHVAGGRAACGADDSANFDEVDESPPELRIRNMSRSIIMLLILSSVSEALLVSPRARFLAPAAQRAGRPQCNFLSEMMTKLQAGSYNEIEVKAKVERMIKMKPVVMFATTTCPFCEKARKEIRSMGAVMSEFDFDEEADGMAMKAELIKITGQSSVPQVFIGGKFVGGCNDGGMGGVVPLKKSGKLEELLIKSGALVKGATI